MEVAVDLRIRLPPPCYPRLARAGAGRNDQPLLEQGFFAGVEHFRSRVRSTRREVGLVLVKVLRSPLTWQALGVILALSFMYWMNVRFSGC